MALSSATQEAVWLQNLFAEMNTTFKEPITLMEDNQSTIAIGLSI